MEQTLIKHSMIACIMYRVYTIVLCVMTNNLILEKVYCYNAHDRR